MADGSSSTEDDDTDVVSYPQLRISSLQLNHYSGVGCVEMVGRLQFAAHAEVLLAPNAFPPSLNTGMKFTRNLDLIVSDVPVNARSSMYVFIRHRKSFDELKTSHRGCSNLMEPRSFRVGCR